MLDVRWPAAGRRRRRRRRRRQLDCVFRLTVFGTLSSYCSSLLCVIFFAAITTSSIFHGL
ncbi:hypothetical protein BD311DRAFT_749750 [Dichomitus squalens]|uniref:Uncharacterized protein n=1 Tax=Dichomitus squalens TaxID=114155 RepID=A0A4Q9MZ40_9APHY|nr:hypothetical protein BD311DRAFT_749750 [Dichomitus squalens]